MNRKGSQTRGAKDARQDQEQETEYITTETQRTQRKTRNQEQETEYLTTGRTGNHGEETDIFHHQGTKKNVNQKNLLWATDPFD